MVSDLEEINHPKEIRLSRQSGSNVRKTDRLDGVHFDLTFLHPTPPAYLHMRTGPDADTASDFSTTDAIPHALGERHRQPLRATFATLLRRRHPSGNVGRLSVPSFWLLMIPAETLVNVAPYGAA
jgi:hypothetical protein